MRSASAASAASAMAFIAVLHPQLVAACSRACSAAMRSKRPRPRLRGAPGRPLLAFGRRPLPFRPSPAGAPSRGRSWSGRTPARARLLPGPRAPAGRVRPAWRSRRSTLILQPRRFRRWPAWRPAASSRCALRPGAESQAARSSCSRPRPFFARAGVTRSASQRIKAARSAWLRIGLAFEVAPRASASRRASCSCGGRPVPDRRSSCSRRRRFSRRAASRRALGSRLSLRPRCSRGLASCFLTFAAPCDQRVLPLRFGAIHVFSASRCAPSAGQRGLHPPLPRLAVRRARLFFLSLLFAALGARAFVGFVRGRASLAVRPRMRRGFGPLGAHLSLSSASRCGGLVLRFLFAACGSGLVGLFAARRASARFDAQCFLFSAPRGPFPPRRAWRSMRAASSLAGPVRAAAPRSAFFLFPRPSFAAPRHRGGSCSWLVGLLRRPGVQRSLFFAGRSGMLLALLPRVPEPAAPLRRRSLASARSSAPCARSSCCLCRSAFLAWAWALFRLRRLLHGNARSIIPPSRAAIMPARLPIGRHSDAAEFQSPQSRAPTTGSGRKGRRAGGDAVFDVFPAAPRRQTRALLPAQRTAPRRSFCRAERCGQGDAGQSASRKAHEAVQPAAGRSSIFPRSAARVRWFWRRGAGMNQRAVPAGFQRAFDWAAPGRRCRRWQANTCLKPRAAEHAGGDRGCSVNTGEECARIRHAVRRAPGARLPAAVTSVKRAAAVRLISWSRRRPGLGGRSRGARHLT